MIRVKIDVLTTKNNTPPTTLGKVLSLRNALQCSTNKEQAITWELPNTVVEFPFKTDNDHTKIPKFPLFYCSFVGNS